MKILLLISMLLVSSSANLQENCTNIFKISNDENGKANIGFINVIVPKKLVDTGFELEVLFEIGSFAIEKANLLPKLEMIDNEATVLESIRSGESIKYAVIFNLEKKVPNVVRIAINDWSGFSPNIRISQIMCDNLDLPTSPSLLISHTFRPSRAKLPAIRCTMDYNFHFSYCGFNLHLNETHPHIIPLSDMPPLNVTKIYLGGESDQTRSKIHTLTHDFCETFPNILVYSAFGLGLIKIHKNAFSLCQYLETIDLSHNNLTSLDADLFEHNTKLRGMFIGVNQLLRIEPEMFRNIPLLEEIIFSYNKLKEFNIGSMRKLPNLKRIYLHENQLLDLDEHQIIEKFPHLQEILWMCPNKVNHERMDAIHEFFNALNITTEEKYCGTRK